LECEICSWNVHEILSDYGFCFQIWSASGIVSGGGSETWNEIWNESARNLENENGGGIHDERPCLQSV